MLNLDTFLPAFLFMTRFAESYSEGTYGSGAYNEADSTTPDQPAASSTQPVTSGTVTQPNGTPMVNDGDQPVSSTDDTPRTTTSQPSTQPNTTPETTDTLGGDPMTIILSVIVALAILATVIVLIVKKLSRRQ